MTDTIVFYHANCSDGFGAAFTAWLVLGTTAEYVPYNYGDDPPMDVTGQRVFIVDLSFDIDVMTRIDSQARELVLLDHHVTAQNTLGTFKCRCGSVKIDLTRSGAQLAWDYFHPGKATPALIAHVQDRDLWRWKLPASRDYLAALDAEGYDYDKWKRVLEFSPQELTLFVTRGNAMNQKYQELCDSIAEPSATMPVTLLGHKGLMVNASTQFTSEVGSRLADRCGTFGLVWKLDKPDRVKVSLRSVRSFDVEVIARTMGGGGHPQASSFYVPFAKLPSLIDGTLAP